MTNEEFIKNISFEGEEWRDVVGFEGLYMVSSFGRVISLKREVRNTHCSYRVVGQHILTPNKNTSRPKYIRHSYHLYKNKRNRKSITAHRIVATAFIPNPNNYPDIDHIDGNPLNNNVHNLRWNLDQAFTRFFREKKGFPKFKSKRGSRKSFKNILNVHIDFDNNRIKLPKLGWVRFYSNQVFKGKIGTVTVSKSPTNKYYISILVDNGLKLPGKSPINPDTAVGIDVGIKTFATLSNGSVFENPKYLERSSARLRCLQRRLTRKQKGSRRREKARLAVAKAYEHISNQRHNFLHHVVNNILGENQTVVIEDLNVEGMMKNHKLANSIASCSWSEFFRILSYKSDWKGVNLIRIGRFEPSSKMCECGYVHRDLKLSDRIWTCPSCGAVNDRDLLAARNIKKFGLEKQNLLTQ